MWNLAFADVLHGVCGVHNVYSDVHGVRSVHGVHTMPWCSHCTWLVPLERTSTLTLPWRRMEDRN